jgi:hypothetical protein
VGDFLVAPLDEAPLRLVHDASLKDEDINRAVQTGFADIEAGRYTTVANDEDAQRLGERMMARLRVAHLPD